MFSLTLKGARKVQTYEAAEASKEVGPPPAVGAFGPRREGETHGWLVATVELAWRGNSTQDGDWEATKIGSCDNLC